MRASSRPTPSRRGSAAVEFALVMPVLMAILMGIIDYGWFYLKESLVADALRVGVRAGSLQAPADEDASGACSTCATLAAAVAAAELATHGVVVDPSEVTPTVEAISGTCALVLEPTIPHRAMLGLVPVPDFYAVRAVAYAYNVSGC